MLLLVFFLLDRILTKLCLYKTPSWVDARNYDMIILVKKRVSAEEWHGLHSKKCFTSVLVQVVFVVLPHIKRQIQEKQPHLFLQYSNYS